LAPYHQLSSGGWVEVGLDCRLWVEGFVGDRIPAFVLFLVDEALLLQ
jgi:hypothetical protein